MFSRSNIRKVAWLGLLQVAVFVFLFFYCYDHVKRIILERKQKNEAILSPVKDEPGLTKIAWDQVKSSHAEKVNAGIYLDRIQDLDIVHSRWSYEMYAWFKWNPQKINFIDLRDSVKGNISAQNSPIKIVNGDIENIDTHSFYLNAKRDSAYILFHITATTTKFFDVSQYPLDGYLLMVQLENVDCDINKFVFVPDSVNSNFSSRVSINGFEKGNHAILSTPHTIKSSLGDPRISSNQPKTYSQLRFGLFIRRGGLAIYLKIFITLYIAALLGFLSFFAAENDKIRVIVGSLFFAAATLNVIITRIPSTAGISIAEIVNDISLVTILLIAARETVVKYLLRNNNELDLLNKWITFSLTLVFYIVINVAIPYICLRSLS